MVADFYSYIYFWYYPQKIITLHNNMPARRCGRKTGKDYGIF